MAGPELITLGCRLNIAESEAMRALAAEDDGLVIVNSCAVTAEAVRQTRQAIRRAAKRRPEARIVVTGCAAQIDPAMFAAMPEVDRVLGQREKLDTASYRAFAPSEVPTSFDPKESSDLKVQVSDIMAVRDTAPQLAAAFAEHARAFVEVQNGCDHRCTFCIIPYGRGNSRSVPAGAVIDQVARLVDAGHGEIVLTGVDVTSYGADLPGAPTLGLLIERLLNAVPGLRRLRLSSLDSVEIDARLLDLVTGDARVMPHLHLSLQAGDDMVLKRMKRRHDRAQAIALAERLKSKRPDIAIGADLIAGFPTETEAMFENSLKLVEECQVVHGHVFPYSPREGTPAARMPHVEPALVKERAARLRTACEDKRKDWLNSLIDSRQSVLVERDGISGHAENFAPIRLSAPAMPGEIIGVRVNALAEGRLIAERAL